MTKTFEEIIEKEYYFIEGVIEPVVTKKDCIELMELVRQQTLIEASNKAEADVNIFKSSFYNLQPGEDYEVYVLKESILQLDKNSIEI